MLSRRNFLCRLPLVAGAVPAAKAIAAEPAHSGHSGPSAHIGAVGMVDPAANGFDPQAILRDFDEGVLRDGVREWELVADEKEIEVAPGVKYAAWAYNGRVPGPTLRAREGERLRIRFINAAGHPHTIHFHGIHTARMDGVPGVGAGNIEPGEETVYEFTAEPFGLHLYHCHSSPLADHIAKGLYGAFVIDPREGRPEADEMVMVMNGFDTNFDRSNEVYAVNTVAFAYQHDPVRVKRGELVRIYLVNALEFDLLNSFHVHANFFDYYPTGTSLEPTELTDTVIQGQGQRGILELRFPYEGRYMFHAHVSEFAELGWMGFFDVASEVLMEAATVRRSSWLAALLPLVLLGILIAFFIALDAPGLERNGIPVEEVAVERAELHPGEIELTLQNDGPDSVRIEQAIVNDGFAAFEQDDDELGRLDRSKVTIDYPWIEGEAYEVVLLTSTGGTVDKSIEVAAETPDDDAGFYGLMGLIGLYVGIIPIAVGMLWLPWMRQLDRRWLRFLLALTIGLLVFLGIDAALEGLDLGASGAESLGGGALMWLGAALAYLLLVAVDGWLSRRGEGGEHVALLVAIGIGLHNLGEGLVIGSAYAIGSLALGATLVVGFAIHNTTEGLAIVAPVAEQRPRVGRLAMLGLIAGAPAILGAWIGASAFDPSLAAFMFGVGVGAIARVVVQIAPQVRDSAGRLLHPLAAGGLAAGLALMYVTSLLISV